MNQHEPRTDPFPALSTPLEILAKILELANAAAAAHGPGARDVRYQLQSDAHDALSELFSLL